MMQKQCKKKEIWDIVNRLLLGAIVYLIWQERNIKIFSRKYKDAKRVAEEVISIVRMKLMGLVLKDNPRVMQVRTN